MPYYFEVTPPGEEKVTLGPFPDTEAAEACRDAVINDKPDHTVGEAFSEGPTYLDTLPKPMLRVAMDDGSAQEYWSDGSERTIPAE
jgi:hypothetical protein